MTSYWVSTPKATGVVEVDDAGIITDTAPIWKRYRGMPWVAFSLQMRHFCRLKYGSGNHVKVETIIDGESTEIKQLQLRGPADAGSGDEVSA